MLGLVWRRFGRAREQICGAGCAVLGIDGAVDSVFGYEVSVTG
jgi:hypothetical protein